MTVVAYVPPVIVTWLAIVWATTWSTWATIDAFRHPRDSMPVSIAHAVHLVFCLQWAAFLTMQLVGVWTRAQYLGVVAPYAPIVFAAGPWAIWPMKHWFFRHSKRLPGTGRTETEPTP